MKKTKRKLLAVLLAFTMLFGSSMTVFAQEYEWDELFIGQELYDGDQIIVMGDSVRQGEECDVILEVNSRKVDGGHYPGKNKFSYTISIPENKAWKVDNKYKVEDASASPCCKCAYFIRGYEIDVAPSPSPNPTPSSTSTPSSNPVEEPTKVEEVHSHSYSWETVQEATTGQDGIEEYRCSCGAVAERNVIPAGMAMVKDLVRQIETAPENSTVGIKTEYFTCYTAYIMNALRKRPDVSLKTTFKDYDKDGSIKTFTIPAGKVPDDGELFYGFTYLGNLYGWDE